MRTSVTTDMGTLESILERYRDGGRTYLLPALHAAQRAYGYLPPDVLADIGRALRVPLADVYGAVEFYTMFYTRPIGRRTIRICTDPACAAAGAEDVLRAACAHAGVQPGETTHDGEYTVERVTCIGLCDQAPAALVGDRAQIHISVEQVEDLFQEGKGSSSQLRVRGEPRILTRNIGKVDPTSLDDYIESGGFAALRKALTELTPEQVIEQVKASAIVGRGGAAFPTGLKWQFTRGAAGEPKYVVCNADESEPGTFKDRVLLEGDPFRVLEGILLCGYAIGAQKGYLFIRGEYPQAAEILQDAVEAMYTGGYLGHSVLATSFSFDLEIRVGAGAYICGEETALFEAIEGKRGYPRIKPPFPTTHGLFGKPTTINNVETLAAMPDIIRHGGGWFRQWGTEKSAGTKLFCVSGHVSWPGVVEVPFGTTVREVLEKHCDGVEGDLQTILMGGAAGAFLSPDKLDTPLTFENTSRVGVPIGSGVLMVFNTTMNLLNVLRQLAHFFAHESCGKCYPCQLGTQRQMEILDRAAEGRAQPGDRQRLLDIGQTMTDASLCGLGQTAASAVLSALKLWPNLIE